MHLLVLGRLLLSVVFLIRALDKWVLKGLKNVSSLNSIVSQFCPVITKHDARLSCLRLVLLAPLEPAPPSPAETAAVPPHAPAWCATYSHMAAAPAQGGRKRGSRRAFTSGSWEGNTR